MILYVNSFHCSLLECHTVNFLFLNESLMDRIGISHSMWQVTERENCQTFVYFCLEQSDMFFVSFLKFKHLLSI